MSTLKERVSRQIESNAALNIPLSAELPDGTDEDRAEYAALSLYALHKRGATGVVNVPGATFGGALRALMYKRGEDSNGPIMQRFSKSTESGDLADLYTALSSIVKQFKSEGISLDYPQLAEDLLRYQQDKDAQLLKWGRQWSV